MTERWLNEVGGQVSEPVELTNPRHKGRCNHPDQHECPWLNVTVDVDGYERAVQCHCTEGSP